MPCQCDGDLGELKTRTIRRGEGEMTARFGLYRAEDIGRPAPLVSVIPARLASPRRRVGGRTSACSVRPRVTNKNESAGEWLRNRNGRVGRDRDAYYRRVLAVTRETSFEDLKAACEIRILKYFPDKFQEFGPEFQDLARERLKDVDAAYAHLRRIARA